MKMRYFLLWLALGSSAALANSISEYSAVAADVNSKGVVSYSTDLYTQNAYSTLLAQDTIAEFSLGLGGATITSAMLELPTIGWSDTYTSVGGKLVGQDNNDIVISGYSGDGKAESSDYNSGTISPVNVGTVGDKESGPNDAVSVDVTSIVQSLANSGAAYAGFDIQDKATGTDATVDFYDDTTGDLIAFEPTLIINYTPAPVAAPLPAAFPAGAFLLAAGGWLRRRPGRRC